MNASWKDLMHAFYCEFNSISIKKKLTRDEKIIRNKTTIKTALMRENPQ